LRCDCSAATDREGAKGFRAHHPMEEFLGYGTIETLARAS